MSDPIAPHSAPISAYMSVHQATNLAYVRYFGNIDDARSATFERIEFTGFHVSYEKDNGTTGQVFIAFNTPLTNREDIRPVLQDMAKEAEDALGLPSSLAGAPPMAAIAKALYAQTTNIYTPPEPAVPLNIFYRVPAREAISVSALFGFLALMGRASDSQLPRLLLPIRQSVINPTTANKILNTLVYIHIGEASMALLITLRRGWYSSSNVVKWSFSTLLYGVYSMRRLLKHGKDVQGL
ncbi:unnamed protein product [Absidia cylindrospora]